MARKGMSKYQGMRLITFEEYLNYVREHPKVRIGNAEIEVGRSHYISQYQPKSFTLETTTVWSFPDRGEWATHKGNYRGNWSPFIPRNLILRYSLPGETVLDQMCGGGTTLVEAKLLGRNAIGVDINYEAVILTLDRLNFAYWTPAGENPNLEIKVYQGDARNLDLIEDESIDLIATHPPYYNIIPYSKVEAEGDLSRARNLEEYLQGIREIAEESFRVLKPGRYAAILIGDTRRKRHYVPIAFRVLQQFLEAGFILKEDIIKLQWKTKTTREKWIGIAKNEKTSWVKTPEDRRRWMDFYLIAHEHLFVFRKPREEEKLNGLKYSRKWW